MNEAKIMLQVTIHDTPAALRYGGPGYFVTFAGTELDKAEALKLAVLNGMRLKLTVELDDGTETQTPAGASEGDRQAGGKSARWP